MKHTISCLVYNKPGVLVNVAKSFSEEGINIYSLAVGEVEEEDKSRMSIVVDAEEKNVKKAEKHLKTISNVIKIHDFQAEELIGMELLLIKIRIAPKNIPQILQIAELFNAQVIAVSEVSMILSLASEEKRVNGLIKMLRPLGIIEMSRSGKIAISTTD